MMDGGRLFQASLTGPDKAYGFKSQDRSRRKRAHKTFLTSNGLAKRKDPSYTADKIDSVHSVSSQSSSPWVSNVAYYRAKAIRSRFKRWTSLCLFATLNPHAKPVQQYTKFLVIACLIGIFLDPLFFLLFTVKEDYSCIAFSTAFATVVTVLRSITDFIYFTRILLQFKLAVIVPRSNTSGSGDLIHDPKEIRHRYWKRWFLVDLLAVLPLPQVMLWVVVHIYKGRQGNANVVKNLLRATLLLQNLPRFIRILPELAGNSQLGSVFETALANLAINVFMYLLAAHIVGCCWYLFGLQRVNYCLHRVCEAEAKIGCDLSFLDCGEGKNLDVKTSPNKKLWMSQSAASSTCLDVSTGAFPYGIYQNSVQVTMTSSIFSKYSFSLFWGFLQISTFAGNLVPSLFVWEVLFTMLIIGLGLLLFALLIGNVQTFLQSFGRRRMDMQLRRDDVELWMIRRNLSIDLRKKVHQAERYKWATSRGVDEDDLLGDLPEDLHKEIRRELVLDFVKQVRIFQFMDDDVLDAILERLQQKIYIEKSVLMRPGYPLEQMLFILRGTLVSIGDDGSLNGLESGHICGEELLMHSLEQAAIQYDAVGKRPKLKVFSTRKVECLTNVEVFSLKAADLEFVTDHFSHKIKNSKIHWAIRYESPYFKSKAARRIQAAWRARRRFLKREDTAPGQPKRTVHRWPH